MYPRSPPAKKKLHLHVIHLLHHGVIRRSGVELLGIIRPIQFLSLPHWPIWFHQWRHQDWAHLQNSFKKWCGQGPGVNVERWIGEGLYYFFELTCVCSFTCHIRLLNFCNSNDSSYPLWHPPQWVLESKATISRTYWLSLNTMASNLSWTATMAAASSARSICCGPGTSPINRSIGPRIGVDSADHWACGRWWHLQLRRVHVFSRSIKFIFWHILTFLVVSGGSFPSLKYRPIKTKECGSLRPQRRQYLALARIRSNSKSMRKLRRWRRHAIGFHHFPIISFTYQWLDVKSWKWKWLRTDTSSCIREFMPGCRSRLWT